MVFQDEQLFPHRDVAANVAFGLRMQRRRRPPSATARVAAMLDLVGLAGFGAAQVTDLSGGEAKRVALARSLAPAPRALLLDEPLTGLDRELHDRLAGELARILRAAGDDGAARHPRPRRGGRRRRPRRHDGRAAGGTRACAVVELTADDDPRPAPARAARRHAEHGRRLRRRRRRRRPCTSACVDEPGTLVAVSTWARRPFPADPAGRPAVQLRGMAVDPARQRHAAPGRSSSPPVSSGRAPTAPTLVWANARDTALAFYAAHGFEVVGDGFVDADDGRPPPPHPPPRCAER